MLRSSMIAAALATSLGATAAVAAPAPLDPGVYTPRTDAPALTDVARRWTCTAHSPMAWGQGRSRSLATARRMALYQCAVRTPPHMVCVITRCR